MLTGTFGLYSKKDDDAKIKIDFQARHGYPPVLIVETAGGKLAGPITPGNELKAGDHVTTGGEK